MLIRKILAALDGSEPSSEASVHPTGLAKRFQATLIAIHVIDPRYRHLETALSRSPGRFKEKILILAEQEAYQHLDNVKQNASVSLVNLGDGLN
jgi:nucleotide-binding universal stress UspA family protein